MKQEFWHYYPPDDTARSAVASDSFVALDACALLHAYRLAPDTAHAWLGILESLGDRLWIPHQAALEYQRNRLSVVADQHGLISTVGTKFDDSLISLQKELGKSRKEIKRSRVISQQTLEDAVAEARLVFETVLDNAAEHAVDLAKAKDCKDPIHVAITKLLAGKVGQGFTDERLEEIYKDGAKRYSSKIPPGWGDSGKPTNSGKYADLTIWYEFLEKAKTEKLPGVLITEDAKADWWRKQSGQTVSPLPALRQEFFETVQKPFWLYTVAQFMRTAPVFGLESVNPSALKDADELEAASSSVESYSVSESARTTRIRSLADGLEQLADSARVADDSVRDKALEVLAALLENELNNDG